MKKITTFLMLFLLAAYAFAQTKIDAKTIIDQLNRGEAVAYQNAEITGDLDFTTLENKKLVKDNDHNGNHESYLSKVKSSLRFVDCRFTGKVLAYYSENNEPVYNADFGDDVIFENCVFEQESAFKYSDFAKSVSFKKCTFNEEALFKYSKFATGPNFSNAIFENVANFKYVRFPKGVDFEGASFKKEANFKYANFSDGVRFSKASFNGFSNFKYTKFSEPLELTDVSFSGDEDFKYAEVDGKNFSSYLLRSK